MERLAYSVPEAAKAIGISERKMRDLVNTQDFPSVHLKGRVVIPVDPLRDWLRKKSESKENVQ